ncbi:MAG TPA: ammonium transporter [Amaricoccus sp.]|uniref:ammonium transporter n=1 Tax=Amaricoccus sp. TaxID=1872485 RepID=UPI002BC98200|nr:ammonium transporter [Amaricoccus sp.]HMQ92993.1 ammonium transporter [Amaricoccus sp.]HMR51918.1 ammonium transporter [Amaricoccus sp.]HMR61016.1 ammonium transporter [Amaricoccus sp.]HMT98720.1 ammonium transporter [Amaricoccus sp.]
MLNLTKTTGLAALGAMLALPARAQETVGGVATEAVAEAVAATVDKGDTTWMITATILVLGMTLPGLALFYGGLVRSKNMLSVLMQVFVIACTMMILWVVYGYSLALNGGGPFDAFIGGFSRLFLAGVTPDSTVATFTEGVEIPEYIFICFQMTFAAITPALIVGGFAERMKFSAVLLFCVLWSTFVYLPIAHMVWYGDGYLFQLGALDFAGGTVVHINAGIAALVGCLVLGKRIGFGREALTPHSLTMTMIGGSLLWFGWFGFNAGSNLEANGGTTLAVINTFVATAGATLGWMFTEWAAKGKPSLLGVVSGAVAGLVAVTPAAGLIGPMGAIVLGVIASVVCFYFVTSVKNALGYDDSLDVFGIHGIGGIVGSIGTGIFVSPALGGIGVDGYSMAGQVWIQFVGVVITIVWCGGVSFLLYKLVDMLVGLRVTPESEREGLDLADHGERAYVY